MHHCLKLIILFALFFGRTDLFAQSVLAGKIINRESESLSNVQVMIRDNRNEKIYAFTTSGKEGDYSIHLKESIDDKKIVFRLLGYDEETIDLSKASFPLNVILIETEHVLNDIVITPPSIRIKKDTTEYFVSAFADGTEGAIEDVLKKLPGITVSDNGTISFKGKQIEKILLDDSDLFDKNYRLASKNVPAKWIDKVQAIENYHENRLLKNVETSDKIILNLSLRNDLNLQRPIGTTAMAGGYEDRYALQTNLLSMNKKWKLYDALNVNNSELSSVFSPENHLNTLYENFDSYANTAVVHAYFDQWNDLEIKRAETQQAFNSLNFVYQPLTQLQITGNLLFNKNRESFTDQTKTLYFTDSLFIDQSASIKEEPKTLYGMIRAKYDIKENIALIYNGKYNTYTKPATNRLFIPESYLYNIDEINQFLMNDLELTIALIDSSALVMNTSLLSNGNSQQFDYSKAIRLSPEINQEMEASTLQYKASIKYYNKNRNNFFYLLQASLNRNHQEISADRLCQSEREAHTVSLDNISLLVNADMKYNWKKSVFSLQSGLGYRRQLLHTWDRQPVNDNRLEFSPRLSYQLNLENHRISLFSSYIQGNFSLLDYTDYFTDYRDIKTRSNIYHYGSSIVYGVSYVYFTVNQTFFLLSYLNSMDRNVSAGKTDITAAMNYSSLIPGSDRTTQLLLINFKKYIDEIRHGITVDNSIYYSEYSNAVNSDVLHKNQALSTNSRFSLKSVWDIPVNYTLGIRLKYSACKTDLFPENHTINYSLFQDLLYKVHRRLKIKVYFDEYFLGKNNRFYLFIRPDITYSFQKYKLSIGVNTYNLLNNNQIVDYQLNDYYSIEQYYSMVPAQYLLNVQFQF